MALIINIETSTPVCSVALSRDGKVLHTLENHDGYAHASHLTVLIERLFTETDGVSMSQVDAVAVSSGPGSYTGLRIGVSTAKGLCFALGKPLIAIGSLDVLTWPVSSMVPDLSVDNRWYCPMIDARRMEVYTTFFDEKMNRLKDVVAEIITADSFQDVLPQREIIFFGDGAAKCKDVIDHPNARFVDDVVPLAKNMARLAQQAFDNGRFEDVAYYEPFYLKDFVATTPKPKVIG
jgi:tRNA threonylcarbamoyladenosine biosynthesis protein TsaB